METGHVKEVRGGVLLSVRVRPGSREFRLKASVDALLLDVTNLPVKGKVNREIIKELGRLFSCEVEIVKGFKSRGKLVLLRGLGVEDVEKTLSSS